MAGVLRDNTALSRFELDVEGHVAFANYRPTEGAIAITHTEVPLALREHGIGSRLVREVLEEVRARGLKVKAYCGFVRAYLAQHPEFNDLL
jgi:hypothetical protein